MNAVLPSNEVDRARFLAMVDRREGECWAWTGATTPEGRGRFLLNGKNVVAPRVAWAIANGREPDKFVCHSCDNPNCVNPDHLWLGSNRDNAKDMCAKRRHNNNRKTHCKNGHLFDEANTLIKQGNRECRECRRVYNRQFMAAARRREFAL